MNKLPLLSIALILATIVPTAAAGDPPVESKARDMGLEFPLGLALGPDNVLYVSERRGHRVIRVDLDRGVATVYAGTGERGFSGDGGPASVAQLGCPDSIDADSKGNLYIADRCNHRIRRVDAETGIITTIAGNGDRGVSPDRPALESALMGAYFVKVVSDDVLLFTDTDSHRVRQIDLRNGGITTLAGSGEGGFSGDGGPPLAAALARPHVAVRRPGGELVIGDSFNQRIREVDREGRTIRTIAGRGEKGASPSGTAALDASFGYFGCIIPTESGDLIVSEWTNGRLLKIRKEDGRIQLLAGTTDPSASDRDGLDPLATRFQSMADVVIDSRGRFIVADGEAGLVRRIDLDVREVETIVGKAQ